MSEYPSELSVWADSADTTEEELQKEYDAQVAKLTDNHPDWSEQKIADRAKKIIYSQVKALKRSRAKPWDILTLGVSGTRDMNNRKRNDLLERWNNPDTKEEAIVGFDGARIKLLIDQETGEEKAIVVDDREYIEFERDGQKRSFKNRNYGKELEVLPVRDVIAIGHRSFEAEDLRVLRISAMRATALTYPKIGVPIRSRLNLREENEMFCDLRTAAVTKWTTEIDIDWDIIEGIEDITTPEGMFELLSRLPDWMQVADLDEELADFHEQNAEDFGRACVIEGDVVFVSTEPNATGSYSMAVEDAEAFDLEADAIQGFVPGLLKEDGYIDFDAGTHIRALVRTNKSPAWDSERNAPVEPDPETGEQEMRIQFNYLAIAADPDETVPLEDVYDEAAGIEPA